MFKLGKLNAKESTQDALLRWRRHNESIGSVFFRELLVEAEEVTEAPPHGERLVAEHGQRGLKQFVRSSHILCSFLYSERLGCFPLQYADQHFLC